MNMRLNNQGPQLLQLLTDVQSGMVRLFDARAKHLGLTRAQWRILAGLHGRGGMTQTELAERTAIARSPLGKIIDQLETKGYVERHSDPDDRRINRLFLTDAVAPLLAPAREVADQLEQDVFGGIAEIDEASELLTKLSERLHRLLDDEIYTPAAF